MPSVRRVVDHLLAFPCYEQHAAVALPVRRTLKRRLARVVLRVLPRQWGSAALAPELRRRIEGAEASLVVLRKVRADDRNWDWDPAAH